MNRNSGRSQRCYLKLCPETGQISAAPVARSAGLRERRRTIGNLEAMTISIRTLLFCGAVALAPAGALHAQQVEPQPVPSESPAPQQAKRT